MYRTLLVLFIALGLSVAGSVSATTLVVDHGGSGDFLDIQSGITAAADGDTILVMPGIYTGAGNWNLDFDGTNCVLVGDGGAANVTIDCDDVRQGFNFGNDEGPSCVVDGFTVTGGAASHGAGAYFIYCAPTIRNCVFNRNVAATSGGAVFCSTSASPSFTNCTFSLNSAYEGGAVGAESASAPTFTNCDFVNNEASGSGHGGAAFCTTTATPSFSNCTFSDNSARSGGAVGDESTSTPTFTNCDFVSNEAEIDGGAMWLYHSAPTLTDCTFATTTACSWTSTTPAGSS